MYFLIITSNIITTDCVMKIIQYWEIKLTMGFRVMKVIFSCFVFSMNSTIFIEKCIVMHLFLLSFFKAVPMLLKELGCYISCKTLLSTFSAELLPPEKLSLSHSGTVNSLNLLVVACWTRQGGGKSKSGLTRKNVDIWEENVGEAWLEDG